MSLPTLPAVVPTKLAAALMGVVGVVAMALLAGCGSAHTDTPTPPPNAAATTSTSAATSPPTTADGRRGGTRRTTTTGIAATTEPTVAPTTATTPTSDATSTTAVGSYSTSSTSVLPTSTSTSLTTTTTSASQVRVIADCQTASYEPGTIILACGDGGISATRISWASWGATSATGTAVIVANLCNPDCAQGSTGSFPATISLSGVTAGSSGPIFSSLTANFAGPSPSGTPSETYSLSGLG